MVSGNLPTTGAGPVMGNRDLSFSAQGWAAGGDTQVATVNSGSAKTLDNSDVQVITLNAATPALTAPPVVAGQRILLKLVQDGSGSRVPTWVGVKWAAGTAPTLSTPAGSVDLVRLEAVDGQWLGSLVGKAFA